MNLINNNKVMIGRMSTNNLLIRIQLVMNGLKILMLLRILGQLNMLTPMHSKIMIGLLNLKKQNNL